MINNDDEGMEVVKFIADVLMQLILFGPAIISVDVTFVNKGYATIMTNLPHHLFSVLATRANSN